MTIGIYELFASTFDGTGAAPAELTPWGQYNTTEEEPETAFARLDGRLNLSAGAGSTGLKVAYLPASLFGNANYSMEVDVDEMAGSAFLGIMGRMTEPAGASVNGYMLGRWGSNVYINRVINGVPLDPALLATYRNALDNEPTPHRLLLEIDSNGSGDPVLRVSVWRSGTSEFELIGEVVDNSASKLTAAGRVGFATNTYYDAERLKYWDNAVLRGTPALVDTTPPELSAVEAEATSPTTATLTVTTDEANGTLYAVFTTSATPPTAAQVRLGQNHTGAAATWSGNQSVASAGAKSFSATGLPAGATLYPHTTHRDAANNDSVVASGDPITLAVVPALTLNGDNVLIEGEAIALESTAITLTGATSLYLRHSALKIPQADLVVVDADSATATYVGTAAADVGMPFTTENHVIHVGITVDDVDHEVVVNHIPEEGTAYTVNPSTMVSGNGSMFKSLLAWFTSQSLVPSVQDQCTAPDEIDGTPVSWLLDSEGNITGYIEEGPQTGTATAVYWLASNNKRYSIPMTLVDGAVDTIAPNLIAGPTLTEITQTTATLSATPDDSGNYGIAVLVSGALPPNGGDILAGTVSGAVWSRSSTAMTANVQFQAAMASMLAGSAYRGHVALQDAAGNVRVVSSNPWTMVSSDTTAPDITGGISITSITQTTATLSATANESGEYGIAILPAAAAAPGASAILGGSVPGAVWFRSATAMAAGVAFTGALNNMTAGNQFRAHVGLRDAAGNTRVVSSNPWTMQASSSDTTAPSITAGPSISNLLPNSFDITFTPDEGGSYRIVLLPVGASVPSAAEVLAGTGAGGVAPIAASTLLSMFTGAPVTTPFTGLQADQPHVPYVALRDAAGNTRRVTVGTVTTPALPDIEHPAIAIGAVAQGDGQLVTAAVTDNIGVVGVQFFVNGQSIGAELVSPPWQWLWQTTGYPNGAYVITAQARDGSGNTTLSNSVLVQINRDSAPAGAPLSRRGARTYEQRGATWFEVEEGR